MRIWLTVLLLWAIYASPALLGFYPTTYGWMKYGHFITFILSVFAFVNLGRHLFQTGRDRLATGFCIGALTGALGAAATQYLLHLPKAEAAFIAQLPGVPRQAAETMLHLHLFVSTLLSAVISAFLSGFLGAFSTWWGGRGTKIEPDPEEPPSQPVNPGDLST